MKLEISLYGVDEKISVDVCTKKRSKENLRSLIHSMILNFNKEFTDIRNLNSLNSYLYFNVIILKRKNLED